MIKKVDLWAQTLHFSEPFKIAYEEVDRAEVVFVRLRDDRGNIGLGSAAPDLEITGETINSVLKKLKAGLNVDFFGSKLESPEKYHYRIQTLFADFPSAQHAVEEAVINLYCSKNRTSLLALLGGKCREEVDLMFTIGIKTLPETIKSAKKLFVGGCQSLKLKVGLNLANDIDRILAVTKILPANCKLSVDANHGYNYTDAKKLLDAISQKMISFVEQPVDTKDLISLKRLHMYSKIPIIADEACVTFDDAKKLLAQDIVSGVNVKLMKCGGPFNFVEIFKLAKSRSKLVMIGCMYESNVSIATGAQLAMALPIDFVDLDSGNLDFPDDPVTGGVVVDRGKLKIGGPLCLND